MQSSRSCKAHNLQTGVGYITEFAGRDRVKFFRRPVVPTGDVMTDFASDVPANVQFASSCPALSSPLYESDFFDEHQANQLNSMKSKEAWNEGAQRCRKSKEISRYSNNAAHGHLTRIPNATTCIQLSSNPSSLTLMTKNNKSVTGKARRLPSLTCKTSNTNTMESINHTRNTTSKDNNNNDAMMFDSDYNKTASRNSKLRGSTLLLTDSANGSIKNGKSNCLQKKDINSHHHNEESKIREEAIDTNTVSKNGAKMCDGATETLYCEMDVQTNPFTPNYYIPDSHNSHNSNDVIGSVIDAAEPEILGLAHLHWNDGLPAGREEVELIERLRRRRHIEEQIRLVEAQLNERGNAPPSKEEEKMRLDAIEWKYNLLHELEEQEWAEREEHVATLQSRRLEKLSDALAAREVARTEANRDRLNEIKSQYLNKLHDKLTKLETKRLSQTRRRKDKMIEVTTHESASRANRNALLGHTGSNTAFTENAKRHKDLIDAYVKYGNAACPPSINAPVNEDNTNNVYMINEEKRHGARYHKSHYDVRPLLLTTETGTEQVERVQAPHIEQLSSAAFTVPENAMINKLPTLYKRHEAEKLIHYLTYAQSKIDAQHSKSGKQRSLPERGHMSESRVAPQEAIKTEKLLPINNSNAVNNRLTDAVATAITDTGGNDNVNMQKGQMTNSSSNNNKNDNNNDDNNNISREEINVYDLYRATPKPKRPATPTLELECDITEELADEGCVLLQKLLRGRAVQNDYYGGKERCMGLITELQAASNTSYEYSLHSEQVAQEHLAKEQQSMIDHTVLSATADIIDNTLGLLFQELTRQRDAARLTALKNEAQRIRSERESIEIARRDAQRVERDRQALQFAAYSSITDRSVESYLHDLYSSSIDTTALNYAVEMERQRGEKERVVQNANDANNETCASLDDVSAREEVVCTLLDQFIIPTAVYMNDNKTREHLKHVPGEVAIEVATNLLANMDEMKEEQHDEEHYLTELVKQ